ncbi:MAG: gamma-glutamyltransferase [Thermomicrobiales bacterium]
MSDHYPTSRTTWVPSRLPATGQGGMVASKNAIASQVGVDVLKRGGNAIDAAVATAFTIGTVEPWMNGIGGGGYLVAWIEREQKAISIDYPMIAPAGASPDMFPLVPDAAPDSALFGWPQVIDNANVLGFRSVAVPGTVAGLALALERYGTISLAEAIAPAIEIATNGIPVNWHYTYWIGREAANLARFPGTAAMFLNAAGAAPATTDQINPALLRFPDLARTLSGIAEHGPRWFYEGEIASAIAEYLSANGAPFAASDFANYQAHESAALSIPYHASTVHLAGGASGGISLAQMLLLMDRLELAGLDQHDPAAIHLISQAFRRAFADRFTYLADPDFVDVPLATLVDETYAQEAAAAITAGRFSAPQPGSRQRLGVSHSLDASVPDYMRDGSTTHLSTVDTEGNAVSITQTLLSGWGSRVVAPGTGVLLNNGMMWFDPEPGRPNSVAGNKRMLSNMAPAVVRHEDGRITSLGSSGGRKIMMCNAQLIRNIVDFDATPQHAIDAPRFDTSTKQLVVPNRLQPSTVDRLTELGHDVSRRDESLMLGEFASPVAITRSVDGLFSGGADPLYFPASAIAVED